MVAPTMDFIISCRGGVSPPVFIHGNRSFLRDVEDVVPYKKIKSITRFLFAKNTGTFTRAMENNFRRGRRPRRPDFNRFSPNKTAVCHPERRAQPEVEVLRSDKRSKTEER